MNELNGKKCVLLDFYEGAYGPTIRIDIQSREDLIKIRNIFLKLSQKPNEETNLADCKNVKSIGVNKFVLMSIPDNQETEKKLFLVINKKTIFEFLWKLSVGNWETIVLLADNLIEQDKPGHQYLTEEGIDDALVELAYREYRPHE